MAVYSDSDGLGLSRPPFLHECWPVALILALALSLVIPAVVLV